MGNFLSISPLISLSQVSRPHPVVRPAGIDPPCGYAAEHGGKLPEYIVGSAVHRLYRLHRRSPSELHIHPEPGQILLGSGPQASNRMRG